VAYLLTEPAIQNSQESLWKQGDPQRLSPASLDRSSALKLWELSARMCGLNEAARLEEKQSSSAPKDSVDNGYALITGATGGLGKAFAVECASRGWNLFLTDIHPEALETLAEMLGRIYGIRVLQRTCDMTDAAGRTELFDYFRTTRRQFRFLINVAGLDYEGPFNERTREEIRTIIRLNIEGTLEVTRELLELRTSRAPFHIINVASAAAFSPMPLKAMYAASKRFVLDFTLALREEVRSEGVTVTALCPAGMPTIPETIDAIERQGWMGLFTTQNIGTVVYETLNAALQGKAMVIPGFFNRQLKRLVLMIPTLRLVSILGRRWESARRRLNILQA
jgi:short-subunit dehydrogenase